MVTRDMMSDIDANKPVQIGNFKWWLKYYPMFDYHSQIAWVDAIMAQESVPLYEAMNRY